MHNKKSSIILVGESIECLFTLKQTLDKNCIISGVVFCNQKNFKSRLRHEIKTIKRHGFTLRISQIVLSIYYKLFFKNLDNKFLKKIFKNLEFQKIEAELIKKKIPYIRTSNFHSEEAMIFISSKKPHFLVCHSPYWIEKKVRMLAVDKIVIGGHPGLVPYYRGAHSSFWCIYDGLPYMNGYSIFLLDGGIDSGPLIKQEKVKYKFSLSYKANDYLLMQMISTDLADIADRYSSGIRFDTSLQQNMQPIQVRPQPGIFHFFSFKKKLTQQKLMDS